MIGFTKRIQYLNKFFKYKDLKLKTTNLNNILLIILLQQYKLR